jgi:hypothetical protein
LYFNGAVSGNWGDVGNWWADSGFETPAGGLPLSQTNVVILASVDTASL